MTATTAKWGLIYPTGADAIATVDNTVQALAERLDLLLGEHGTAQINVAAANTNTQVAVVYTRNYGALVPTPQATIVSTFSATMTVMARDFTATGFNLVIRSGVTGNHFVNWSARP